MKGMLRFGLALVVFAIVVAGPGVAKAGAGVLSCIDDAEYPFAPYGDTSPYALAPNGSLENGSDGWALGSGARVVTENNTLRPGSRSLSLPYGSSATSPWACVKTADPASRFFLRGSGKVRVDLVYRSLLGLPMTTTLGYASAGMSWQPGPKLGHLIDNVLGTLALNGQLSASVRFKFTTVSGNCLVDDLFVDPLIQI